jgi:hypothetical protein
MSPSFSEWIRQRMAAVGQSSRLRTLLDSELCEQSSQIREFARDLEYHQSDEEADGHFEITVADIIVRRDAAGRLSVTARIPDEPLIIRTPDRRNRVEQWEGNGHPQRSELSGFAAGKGAAEIRFLGRMSAGGAVTIARTLEDSMPRTWVMVGRKNIDPGKKVIHEGCLVPQSGLSERDGQLDTAPSGPCQQILDPLFICADEATEEICLRSSDLRTAFQPIYRGAPSVDSRRLNEFSKNTFKQRLAWDLETGRVPPECGTQVEEVDAEYLELGQDELTVVWRDRICSRRQGKVVVDPCYAAVDLMCCWDLRFDKKGLSIADILFIDGEGYKTGSSRPNLYNRKVYILEPDQFYMLFTSGERPKGWCDQVKKSGMKYMHANVREDVTLGSSLLPAMNPPLIGAGRALLATGLIDLERRVPSLLTDSEILERLHEMSCWKW